MDHHHVANFSFFTAVCFTINYIVGCGFLGIPHAFVSAGMVAGPILVIFFAFLCNISKDYILETLGRLEALEKLKDTAGMGKRKFVEDDFLITGRKFELADAVERLMGRHAKIVYMILLSLFLYGVLWAYSSVFGTSFAGQVPSPFHGGHTCDTGDCDSSVRFYVMIFGLVAVPLSCMDLEEQVAVQVFMSAARVIVMALMLGTVVGALGCEGYAFELPGFKHKGMHAGGAFYASGLQVLIPTTVYASIFHHSIPVLSQPVKNKHSLPAVFGVGFAFTTFVYVALGLVLGLYFGGANDVSQVNLYWNYYVGCRDNITDKPSAWAQFAKFVILIFPALDVMSAYPLNAVTLGNNLMVSILGHNCPPLRKGESYWNMICGSDNEEPGRDEVTPMLDDNDKPIPHYSMAEKRRLHRWKLFFRLLASVPSLVGSLFKNDLGQILSYTGTVAIVIAFVVPCLLRFQSVRECAKVAKDGADANDEYNKFPKILFPSAMLEKLDEQQQRLIKTPYHALWCNDIAAHVVFLIGTGVFFYVLISLITS